MPRNCVGINLWTMFLVRTTLEEPGPRNKNGHWPFVDLFDKNSQVMGLYEGSLVLRGGALVPEGYHMMPLKRICHVVTQER